MGLGKTLESLAIADFYYEKWPLLIITTKTGLITWKHQIRHWMSDSLRKHLGLDAEKPIDEFIQIIESNNSSNQFKPECKIVLCDFEMLVSNETNFLKFPRRFVIVDESHKIKSTKTQRTSNLIKLISVSEHVLLLSGTPAFSRPNELYSQLVAVKPSLYDDEVEFKKRYCCSWKSELILNHDLDEKYNSKYARNMNELRLVLSKVGLRREKVELVEHFPKKTRQLIRIKPYFDDTLAEIELFNIRKTYIKYAKLHEDILLKKVAKDRKEKENIAKNKQIFYRSLLGRTCEAKKSPVCAHLKNLIENGESKLIVIAYHNKMIKYISDFCKVNKIGHIVIDGETTNPQKESQMDDYKKDQNIKIAVLSYLTLNSLSFNESDHVIFAELYWTPAHVFQAEDRALRIGKQCPVRIDYLFIYEGVDPYVYKKIEKRLGDFKFLFCLN